MKTIQKAEMIVDTERKDLWHLKLYNTKQHFELKVLIKELIKQSKCYFIHSINTKC